MATYQETFEKKLDWAMPFQRTGKFPLDRTSIFESYADALAYAKQDQSDTRKLGGTSYVGQIIAVFGPDAGTIMEDGSVKYTDEVAAYIIKAVGENAALMKLAQASATGDLATDVGNLQTALGALENRVSSVEAVVNNYNDTDTTYSFTTGTSTDGSIHIVTHLPDGTTQEGDVQVRGWSTLLGIASGRTTAFVYQDKNDAQYIKDIAEKDKYKVGDLIYFKETAIPDEWVSEILSSAVNSSYYKFSKLETEHPDLSGYLTTLDAQNIYATKEQLNNKADLNTVTQLQNRVDKNAEDILTKANQSDLQTLQNKVNNIDVTNQITTEINKLNATSVGGTGLFILSIKQHNGVIEAVALPMPDMQGIAKTAADGARDAAIETSQQYVDNKVGDISTGVTIKTYVDNAVYELAQEVSALKIKVGTVENSISNHDSRIGEVETATTTHTTQITLIQTKLSKAEGDISNIQAKISKIEENAELNVIEVVKIGGVALPVDATDRSVNISSISTDLLTQGTKPLILDCGAARLSK